MSAKMRRMVAVLLGVGTLVLLAICQPPSSGQVPTKTGDRPGLPAPKSDVPNEFTHDITLPINRKLRARMESAQDYIASQEWAEACHLLQGLLDTEQDSFAPIVRKTKDGKQYVSYVSVKSEANRMIGQLLPPEGLKFYRATHNPTAQRMLEDGLKQSDWELVARVAVNYLHTDAGGQAASLLATHWLDRGDFHAAALYFEKLIQRNGMEKLDTLSLIKAAIAFHALKDSSEENSGTYESIMRVLQAKCPDGVPIDDHKIEMVDFTKEIGRYVSAKQLFRRGETPFIKGSVSRNAQGIGSTPLLEPVWTPRPVVQQREFKELLDASEKKVLEKQPVIPGMFPITVTMQTDKDTIPMVVYRSFYGVHAVDMRNGARKWEADSRFAPDKVLGDPSGTTHWTTISSWIKNQSRPQQLWENSLIGSISTDGKFVYVVDDLYVTPATGPNPYFDQFGRPTSPPISDQALASAVQYNQLQAYDLRSGKIKWYLGSSGEKKAESKETTPKDLQGAYFLGPPLPLAGKLFVMIEKDQELRLLCLDPTIDPNRASPIVWSQALAETRFRLAEQPQRRTQAAHLAYGQGIMVCPTNAGAVLGIDLLSHSLVWASAYRTTPGRTPDDQNQPQVWRGRFPQQPQPPQFINKSEWKSTPPIIVDGKVVYAPQDGDSLICLNLKDGTAAWDPIKRSESDDDLYVAGVFSGKILVVSKKSVKAFNLADGKKAYEIETGMPSGQGVASDNMYYLPLRSTALNSKDSEPEICVIDVDKGSIASHVKSRSKEPPGNLVFFEGQMISQSSHELVVYPQLAYKIAQADRALAQNPNDPLGRTDRAQLRLYRGDRDGAIEDLHVALENNPPDGTRRKARKSLHECFTELLINDFNANEKWLDEFKKVSVIDDREPPDLEGSFKLTTESMKAAGIPEDVLTKLTTLMDREIKGRKKLSDEISSALEDDPMKGQLLERILKAADHDQRIAQQRQRLGIYWYLVASGRDHQGKLKDAFEAYLSYAHNAPQGALLTSIDQPSVESPPDVWARGRISAMLARSTPEQRKPLEDLIDAKWNEIKNSTDLKPIEDFVTMFGTQFKVAREARLVLADKLMQQDGADKLTQAESQLIRLRDQKEDRQMAARAVEGLARLMTRKNLLEEGAYYYSILGKQYRDVVIRDGKTGGDLFDELATDKRYWGLIDQSGQFFSGVKLRGSREGGGFPMHSYFTFEIDGDDSPYFKKNKVQADLGANRFRVVDRLTGVEQFSVPLSKPSTWFSMVVGLTTNNFQFPGRFPAVVVGHLVIVQMCHMVYCFDPIQKKQLWERNLLGNSQPDPNNQPQVIPDPRDGSITVLYPDAWAQRLGQTGPINSTCVCLLSKEGLIACDPLTGKDLWTRTDVKPPSEFAATAFGDTEYIMTVLVQQNSQSSKSGRVFRASDGVSVDCPDFSAAYQNRVRICGRNILVKDADGTGITLRLYDPVKGKDLWSKKFPLNSIVLRTENPNHAGIVDSDGNVVVFDVHKPEEPFFKAMVKKEHLGNAATTTADFLQDNSMAFLLINEANNPALNPWGGPWSNIVGTSGLRQLPVNGHVYGFDRTTRKIKWYSEVRQLMLLVDSVDELPVLIFTGRYQTPLKPKDGPVQPQNLMGARAIDKRNGKLVLDEIDIPNGPQFHTLSIKPKERTIELLAPNMKMVFKPVEPDTATSGGGPQGSGSPGEKQVSPKPRFTPEDLKKAGEKADPDK